MDERNASDVRLLTRLKITSLLAGIGAACGAGAGLVLTYLGNVISGFPIPPSAGIYASNAGIMAAIGGVLGPPLAWSLLRAVPLWRALAEPAAAAVLASVGTMLFAPSMFVVAVPVAVTAAALRLRWEYRGKESVAIEAGAEIEALSGSSGSAGGRA